MSLSTSLLALLCAGWMRKTGVGTVGFVSMWVSWWIMSALHLLGHPTIRSVKRSAFSYFSSLFLCPNHTGYSLCLSFPLEPPLPNCSPFGGQFLTPLHPKRPAHSCPRFRWSCPCLSHRVGYYGSRLIPRPGPHHKSTHLHPQPFLVIFLPSRPLPDRSKVPLALLALVTVACTCGTHSGGCCSEPLFVLTVSRFASVAFRYPFPS